MADMVRKGCPDQEFCPESATIIQKNNPPRCHGPRYEAVLRLSETLSVRTDPEDLTEILSAQLREFLEFLQFYIVVYKEHSTEVEWAVVGREKSLVASYADVPVQERPSWRAYTAQEPFHIRDWNTDERVPSRLKKGIAAQGLDVGPLVFVPLTTMHRRLGAMGMSGRPGTKYTSEDIAFLRLISQVVAFALDEHLNLRRAEAARAELQRQNEKLLHSERELLNAIETIPSMAWSAEADGDAEFVNRRWRDYTGFTVDQAKGWGWTAAVHPDDLKGLVKSWDRMLASGEPGEIEGRLRRVDGVYRWFLFRATPSFDDKGNVLKWYGTNTDIEERKRAEQVLAVQNTRLQLLLELTKRITSNLELREVLRSISANIRLVMHAEATGVALYDEVSGVCRIFAIDFPDAKGFIKEELVVRPGRAFKHAFESSNPAVLVANDPEELGPDMYRLFDAEGLSSQCLIPLVSRGRTVGVLIVARKLEGSFTRDDVDFLSEASGQIAIAIENCSAYREIFELKEKLAQEKLYLEQEIRGDLNFEQIVGSSPALKRVLDLVETVAPSDSTVLLLGETGTGKELIARAIHDASRRKDRTFVKVNCAAIPTGLLESELFGHEKGAFTGAIIQKVGRLEFADQGTLFLDEVGDIPLEVQPKLLRALQEREFERLGSIHTRKVNIRLIAATNRDLEQMVAERQFRKDLYYRLNVFPIRIPPLRERREDIPVLVSYFVDKFAKQMQRKIDSIPASVMKDLKTWEWPGNIRELENVVERAVILTRGRSLEAPLSELRRVEVGERIPADQDNIARIVKETIKALHEKGKAADAISAIAEQSTNDQRDAIVHALTVSKGQVGGINGAAARMGLNRTTLLCRMKKLGIDRVDFA